MTVGKLSPALQQTAVNMYTQSPAVVFRRMISARSYLPFAHAHHKGDEEHTHLPHEPTPTTFSGSSAKFDSLKSFTPANSNLSKFLKSQRRPFTTSLRTQGSSDTTQMPDFSKYKNSSNSRSTYYMLLGTTGFVGAVGAKNLVVDFIQQLTPGADVLALSKAEVDLSSIPEGKNVTIKWRGKPVFIRHRTEAEISEANSVAISELRDPQTDSERVKQPEWLVVLGICTHLGCVPIGEAGDYDGWYCPCHGSHYDISGRIRKGPAPLNLEVPPYEIVEGSRLVIG